MNASMNRQARRASIATMAVLALVGAGSMPDLSLVRYEQSSPHGGNQRTRRLKARRAMSHPATRRRS